MHFSKPPLGTPLDWGNPLNDGTVLALAMNEGHGDKVQDLSLNGNHGTLHNFAFPPTVASGWNPGQNGIGLNFGGGTDHVDCGNNERLNIFDKITASTLVTDYGQTSNSSHIIAKRTATEGYYMYMNTVASPKIGFIVKIGNVSKQAQSTTELIPFTQYHVAGVYDGTSVNIYIDGKKEATTPATGNIDQCTANLSVGQHPAGSFRFRGSIDQPRIQSRAWSAKEVRDYAMNPWQVYLDEDD